MNATYQGPKGVPDYFPPDSRAFKAVRDALTGAAELAGYDFIEIPVFEDTALFVRGVGESTDIVNKEMFTFEDRGGRSLTLRPEGTVGVLRSIVEHGLDRGQLPVKLWYSGQFFRAERPQAGRYRQFQQVGIEAVGVDDPALDAEVVAIADEGFRALGLTDYRLELTSLGCKNCRPAYRELLVAFLEKLDLDEETRRRAQINPLRVLDDKREAVQKQLTDAPLIVDHLCAECAEHFAAVKRGLDLLGVKYELNPRLVRGLDYYTRTTFEFVHDKLGSQSAMGGGGRYDGLMGELGGQDVSGIGFGLGTDRTFLACKAEGLEVGDPARCQAFLVPLGDQARERCVVLAGELRALGVSVDLAYGGRGLKGAMRGADRAGASYAVVIGDRDLEAGTGQLKDLRSGEQIELPLTDIAQQVKEKLG